MGVVPRGQGTTQNDVIECDPELPMETEIDNTSANNPSQCPVADPSSEAGLVELGCSKLGPIGLIVVVVSFKWSCSRDD